MKSTTNGTSKNSSQKDITYPITAKAVITTASTSNSK